MWKALIQASVLNDSMLDFITFAPPASLAEIQRVEQSLSVVLHDDLKSFLSETNGDGSLMYSIEQIEKINLELRSLDLLFPVDGFLFFAGNGNGGYYGHVVKDGKVISDRVYRIEGISEDRIWIAQDIKQLIEFTYGDKI